MQRTPGPPRPVPWNGGGTQPPQSPASAGKIAISVPRLADEQTCRDVDSFCMPLQAILRRTCSQKKELQQRLDGLKNESTQLDEKRKRLNDEVQTLQSSIANLQAMPAVQKPVAHPPAMPVASAPLGYSYAGQVDHMDSGMSVLSKLMAAPISMELDEPTLKLRLQCNTMNHNLPVHSVSFKPNSTHFASASWDCKVNFTDVDSNSVVASFHQLNNKDPGAVMGGLYSVAFSRAGGQGLAQDIGPGDILGCTSADQNVYLWDCKKKEHIRTLKGHKDEVNGIDFHCSQNIMCTASDDSSCMIWDYTEGAVLRTLNHPEKAVYGAAFFKNHEYLVATACFDQTARVWDIRDKKIVATMKFHTDDVIGIACSDADNQPLMATGSDDGKIGVWDSRTWKQVAIADTQIVSKDNEVKRVAWSPCGNYLAAACSSNSVMVYGLNAAGSDLQLVANLQDFTDCVFDVSWSIHPQLNKLMLVAASHDKTCKCWIQQ